MSDDEFEDAVDSVEENLIKGLSTGKAIEIQITEGAKAGDVITIPVGKEGEMIKYTLPPGAKAGDTITLKKEEDDPNDQEITFVVPKGSKPGTVVKIDVGNGEQVKYRLGPGAKPGMKITFNKNGSKPQEEAGISFHIPEGAPPGSVLDIGVGNGERIKYEVKEGDKPGHLIKLHRNTVNQAQDIRVVVPEGAKGGDVIEIKVGTDVVRHKLPPGAKGGDVIMLSPTKDEDIKYTVPEGTKPGDVMKIPVGPNGEAIEYPLPEGGKPGDVITLSKAPPDEQAEQITVTKEGEKSIFTVPEGASPGDTYRVASADDSQGYHVITIPADAKPGDKLEVEKSAEE
jgi:hypothetical protein